MYILTPYTPANAAAAAASVCRVSESRVCSTAWCCVYILTPYIPFTKDIHLGAGKSDSEVYKHFEWIIYLVAS